MHSCLICLCTYVPKFNVYFRTSIWITGGYYTESNSNGPEADWTHIQLRYYPTPFNGERPGFDVLVDGRQALRDRTRFDRDTAFGDGRIVLGRAYSDVDDFYTSMTIDEVEFYNEARFTELSFAI